MEQILVKQNTEPEPFSSTGSIFRKDENEHKKIDQCTGRSCSRLAEEADAVKTQSFDRSVIAGRSLKYELLDQLVAHLLLGVR